jgi:hypothetical protein
MRPAFRSTMPTSRLYATLIAVGASLTGTVGIAIVAATQPACSSSGHFALVDMQFALIDMQFVLVDMASVDLSSPPDLGGDLSEED